MDGGGVVRGLLLACHPVPTLAVTVLTALLAAAAGASWGEGMLLAAAVLAGQLVIGWSNDLLDAERDRQVGRADKPVAEDLIAPRVVAAALGLAAVATGVLSLAAGWRPGILHLVLVVGPGLAYNLGLKATAWSWLPYAVAFGALPAVAWTGVGHRAWPEAWLVVVGALLGVGAHFLNVLPDLADDAATGVRGLPHRLGERRTRAVAPALLLLGALVTAGALVGESLTWAVVVLLVCGALAVVAWRSRGATPFRAALLMAGVLVAAMVARG